MARKDFESTIIILSGNLISREGEMKVGHADVRGLLVKNYVQIVTFDNERVEIWFVFRRV